MGSSISSHSSSSDESDDDEKRGEVSTYHDVSIHLFQHNL